MKTYQNPIAKKGDFADPFVLRYNGKYYLYCTNPDIRCWSSDDLLEWKLEGPTIGEDEFKDLVPFAPEVVYADGKFYMYTSPSGFGHYVLESESPTGPFYKITNNVQHAIDGTIFIDDDGTWYFYWAGDEGIWGCEMKSPTEFGEPVLTGATMYGWTEGPLVCKRDGIYYMTYTGNHYLSKGYRINAATSKHPLQGYVDEVYNPIIIHTEGEVVGLGHSSTVLGPDLVSHYIVYHNMNEDAIRDLDIDRQLCYKNVTQILGPTIDAQPAPHMPDFAFSTDKTKILEMDVEVGQWQLDGEILNSNTDTFFALSKQVFDSCFTAEFNLILPHCCNEEKRGVVIAESSSQSYRLAFDKNSHSVQLWYCQGGEELCITQNTLPEKYRFEVLHCVRIEKKEDGEFDIYIDNRLQFKGVDCAFDKVRIGYFSEGGFIGCGYTAITESVLEKALEEAIIPMNCAYYPVFGKGLTKRNSDGSITLKEDESIEYSIFTENETECSIFITSCPHEDLVKTDLLLDNNVIGSCTGNRGVEKFNVKLGPGSHTLRLRGVKGTLLVKRIKLVKAENNKELISNEAPVQVGPYGKLLSGEYSWSDYSITTEFNANMLSSNSKAGILIRVTEPAEGGEGADSVLGINFFIGYSISISRNHLNVIRHSYDEKLLATCPYEYDSTQPCYLRVDVYGAEIRVFVNKEEVPRVVVSDVNPIMHGCVGIWAKDSVISCKSINIQN